ncbi:ABC transporter ATP-binding protein/permease [Rhodalgimonas zhirmunskyi]|uniref:ATP-binding cassette domain-containing protein n=1 Tax=Rhodalgimonas zhirmunskyi TaxID=2964767 RepID=A0AAJ1UBT2_9RHOB|nr:ATP-binding cassette domain-containing protein [Rhodoalgimonas zhirmunskyi]MDQ2094963.1 ATP-binding cassette domain-containing protein [Rhodoalgimonas zhirmunskyi]
MARRKDTQDRPSKPRLELEPSEARKTRLAGRLWVLAGFLWPVQAGAVAWAISGWAEPESVFAGQTALCVLIFIVAGALRALLDHRAARLVYVAADSAVHRMRAGFLNREGRRLRDDVSSAEMAALLTQKLPLLAPYITRFRPAMARVRVLPLLFLVIIAPMSWIAAIVLLVAGPLIPIFMALIGMAAKEASEKQMAEIGDMNRLLIDRITALPDLRLLNAEARSRADFEAAAENLRGRTMAVLRIAFLSSTVLELFSAIGVALVAVYVGFSLLGEITIGAWGTPLSLYEGVFILLMAPEFFQPLRDMAAAWHDKVAGEAVLAEIEAMEAAAPEPVLGQAALVAASGGASATVFMSGVTARRGGRLIRLPDIDTGPGQGIVLRGPSGAGKSTTLDVIAGLVRAETGEVRVAGVPLDEDSADGWRAQMALVPQSVHMPDVTLRQFLDPHGRGGDIDGALERAHARQIVNALPDGLDTRLGESGAGVSGGEARRLMLARAFLRGADVILADEPTADLDARTAGLIIDALKGAVAAGTCVIVASHDPRLIEALDAVIDVDPQPAAGEGAV